MTIRIKHITLLTVVLLVVLSCGISKRDYQMQSQITPATDYLKADSLYTSVAIVKDWWSEFQDPVLDTLIARARNNNRDIYSAVANYEASRAYLKGTKLDRLPTVTTSGSFNRTRLGENIFVQGVNPTYSTYSAGFDAYWEADLFGSVSHRIKGAYANNQLSLADMQSVYVSVFAQVAYNYMELRGTQYLLDVAKRNLKGQQETYELTLKLSEAGTSNTLDVSRALTQMETTRAVVPPLQARIEALKNSLSVLLGEVPGELDAAVVATQPLPSLPATVALGNITELLKRRPDVRKAEAALQARIATYNVSVADLYPKIEFGGNIGFSAVDFANFGSKESFTWSIVPRISWAAFNLGRVKQQIKANDALALAALAQYEKTVLQALEEVKTALSNYALELQRREILVTAAKASAQAADIAKKRYTAGLDSFIDYLNAENALLQTESLLAQSELNTAASLVAIYKALGGGWEIITDAELQQRFKEIELTDARTD